MLTIVNPPAAVPIRNPRRERKLWHHEHLPMHSLGCSTCPERSVCGGIRVKEPVFDCLAFCCGKPESCDKVCRKHHDFADRVREVGTFNLHSVPRAGRLVAPVLPRTIPMLFHNSRRKVPARLHAAALPLARMVVRKDGTSRYQTHEALCQSFSLTPGTLIVLSGTDRDGPIERWWGIGEAKRRALIRSLIRIGVVFTTTPNYSLFIDTPRWDDLHAMKRIALVHQEFLSEGLPAALHVNGRTETDFQRWTEYIAARPEVTHLAYEFTTGTSWAGRQEQHAKWLAELARGVNRPLSLILRGGTEVLPILSSAFSEITLLDTSSFIKTMKRKRAVMDGTLSWTNAPTASGAPVDELFHHNVATVQSFMGDLMRAS
ncbi:MAG: hypothetical protein ACK5TN_02580 [Acidobacteriota bacterium]